MGIPPLMDLDGFQRACSIEQKPRGRSYFQADQMPFDRCRGRLMKLTKSHKITLLSEYKQQQKCIPTFLAYETFLGTKKMD